MADQYTPEEISEIFEAYNNAIKSGTPISEDLAKAMKDATKGIKGYADQQSKLLNQMGKSTADFTKAMYQGKQGMTQMNSAVDAVGTGLEFLITLIPGARLLKMGLTLLTKAVGAAIKVTNEQSDALFKTYQDLAKTGAGAADGMRGVFDNMQKFGYGIDQLGEMTQLIKENSKTLSTFGGTVLGGTKAFADSMSEIQRSDIGRQFQRMGYTVDDINRYGAGYIKVQQMLGRTQTEIQKDLTAGTAKYTMELDKLARITGDTREAQEAKAQAAYAEDAFAATMDELKERALAGDKEAEARFNKLDKLMRVMPEGEAKKEMMRAVGGDIAAAQKIMFMAPKAYQQLMDSSTDASETLNTFTKESKNSAKAFRGSYQLNAMEDAGLRYAEIQEYQAKFGEKTLAQQEAAAETEQKVTDQTTKNAADLRISQQQARDALQSFVNIGVSPATSALKTLSSAASGAAKAIPGTTAAGSPMQGQSMGGGGPTGNELYKQIFGGSSSGKSLLDIIGQGESRGNYNALVYGKKGASVPTSANLTDMTIAQVMEYQKGMIGRGHASTAVGKYQMIADTLREQVRKSGLDINTTKFDQKTQDLLAQQLINQAGYGRADPYTVMRNLSGTWASLPKDMSGRGSYDNFNGNRSTIDPGTLMAAITGPSGKFDSKLTDVNPDKTLPPKEITPTGEASAPMKDFTDQFFTQLGSKLDKLDMLSDIADNTKKNAQYAAR